MSKKTIRLTDEQMSALAMRIGKPVMKFLNKKIEKEFSKVPNYADIDITDFVNLVLIILVNIDINKLRWLRMFFKSSTNSEMDFDKLISVYIKSFSSLAEQEPGVNRERLN